MLHILLSWDNLHVYFDGLMQKKHNSSALEMELHLFCIKPSTYDTGVTLNSFTSMPL